MLVTSRERRGTDDGWGPLFDGENVWTSLPCGCGSNVFCDQGMNATNTHWIAIVQYCWKDSGWCGSNWACGETLGSRSGRLTRLNALERVPEPLGTHPIAL
ncbi:MAG TPA: hypothetical protein VLB79_06315 [Solirubrobacterales bacterium]|nr:hypothetical protein [Solirubrobacterales bacterium]